MESEGTRTDPEARILEAMEAVEPADATVGLGRLIESVHSQGTDGPDLARMWSGFKRLLQRRGYYTATASQLATSLEEIRAVGEGFDLFELARGLAQYDVARRECRGLAGEPSIPQLKTFSRGCSCARRPLK